MALVSIGIVPTPAQIGGYLLVADTVVDHGL